MWFSLLFPVVCYFVFAYPVLRLVTWYFADSTLAITLSIASWIIGVAGMYYSFRGPKMIIRYIVVHWMGASFILASLTLVMEMAVVFVPDQSRQIALLTLLLTALLIILAVAFSHHLAVKRHDVYSHKVTRLWRVAQISDVHIGSRQGGFMRRIVQRINQLEPDYVVITGDLVDSSAVGFDELQSIAELNARTYFIIGNHERYADLDKIIAIADRLGLRTLRQESDLAGELNFIGIDDADRRDQVDLHLPGITWDKEKFSVLLYHRPLGWEAAMEHGIDLMLSGHTHNGQIFPFNLVVKQQFNRISGMYRDRHHHLYVSSGTGTWGPLMRLGSRNEISVLDIRPH